MKTRLSNREREMWVENDEKLYHRWRLSGMTKREFIKAFKGQIDQFINEMLGN